MSETPTPDPAQVTPGEPAEKPDETDWKAESRKWEQRAKENKTAAEKLAEIEQANKTELQKAIERAEAAERKAAESDTKVLRAEVAASKGVLASALTGTTKEELEAAADALIAWRDANTKPPRTEPKKLRSGAKSGEDDGRGRAAAAVRLLRGSSN